VRGANEFSAPGEQLKKPVRSTCFSDKPNVFDTHPPAMPSCGIVRQRGHQRVASGEDVSTLPARALSTVKIGQGRRDF